MRKETANLNIDCHLVVLGQFRTGILAPGRRRLWGDGAPPEYATVLQGVYDRQGNTDGKQPGDPNQAAERVVDLVRREGLLAGSKLPHFRLFLGSDCYSIVRKKCEDTLAMLDELKHVAQSTDHADTFPLAQYD